MNEEEEDQVFIKAKDNKTRYGECQNHKKMGIREIKLGVRTMGIGGQEVQTGQ